MLEHRAADRRRERGGGVAGAGAGLIAIACAGLVLGGSSGGGGCGRGGLGSLGGRGGGAVTGVDRSEHRADLHGVADGNRVLAHDAGDRRRDLDRDLVGLEAGDRLVDRDGLAGLLQPLAEGGFGDRFTQDGDGDFGCHFLGSSTPA